MSALVGATVVGTVAAVASIAAQAAALPRAETATSKPSTSCAKVQTTAAKVLAADDAFLNATTTNAEDAALDREDSAIDALATALRGCDAVAMGTACSGLVTTGGQIVASDEEFDRAEGDAAENQGRDGEAFVSWADESPVSPQELPMPPDLDPAELRQA